MLRATAFRAQLQSAGIEREVLATQVNRRRSPHFLRGSDAGATKPLARERRIQPTHLSAAATACAVNAIVQGPIEAVEHCLNVELVRRERGVVAGEAAEN